MKKKMLEKFDKDGDGVLSEEERKAMPPRPGGPDGKGKGKGKGKGERPAKDGGDAEAPGNGGE